MLKIETEMAAGIETEIEMAGGIATTIATTIATITETTIATGNDASKLSELARLLDVASCSVAESGRETGIAAFTLRPTAMAITAGMATPAAMAVIPMAKCKEAIATGWIEGRRTRATAGIQPRTIPVIIEAEMPLTAKDSDAGTRRGIVSPLAIVGGNEIDFNRNEMSEQRQ
jgi:hypothetical protein